MHTHIRPSSIYHLLFIIAFLLPGPLRAESGYSYFHMGEEVSLTPSSTYIVIDQSHATKSLATDGLDQLGIQRDPLSDSDTLTDNYLTLFRITDMPQNNTKGSPQNTLIDMAANINAPMQPVFEQGDALLIPNTEVIVGFHNITDLQQAKGILLPQMSALGIKDVQALESGNFLLTINNPGSGRVYEVCRGLAQNEKISFAEPNHLVIMLRDEGPSVLLDTESISPLAMDMAGEKETIELHQSFSFAPDTKQSWKLISEVTGEGRQFPPTGWDVVIGQNNAQATWGKSNFKKRSGNFSIYCAGAGPRKVRAPGPVPPLMKTFLRSPVYNFSQFQEVYVEVWFYAKNEITKNNKGQYVPKDFPLFGVTNGKNIDLKPMMIVYSDDCTVDPTTKNGWRKILYRVPKTFKQGPARLIFGYISDARNPREGVYIDDIRVIGKQSASTPSLGNDPYAPLQYELMNNGQIAGLGNRNNDMKVVEAWDIAPVSPKVVVAVVDDGVDLRHPDLNVVAGYRHNGTRGGAPQTKKSNHGTSVAGNIGAIRNNNVGVIGTAPNVKIMAVNQGKNFSQLAMAIDTAVAKGARVINNSWGWVGAPSREIEMAVKRALAKNVVVLFAAGNGPDRPPFSYKVAFPGSMTGYTDIITVGATSQTDEHKSASSSDGLHSWGSSYIGAGPDICAPGPWSYTTDRIGPLGYNDGKGGIHADYTHNFGGTSSATPKVAGIVALMLSVNPALTPKEVKQILRKTADDIDRKGFDDKTGAGRVNGYQAVLLAKQMTQNEGERRRVRTKSQPKTDSLPKVDNDGWQTIVQ